MTQISDRIQEEGDDKVSIILRKRKIVTLRYKVYTFILMVILVFFWPTFINLIENIRGEDALKGVFSLSNIGNLPIDLFNKRGKEGLLNQIDELDKQIIEEKKKIKGVEREKIIIERLNNKEKSNTIKTCLNTNNCKGIPQKLMPFMGLLRTYLLIDNLEFEKMQFNQKLVLKNINTFLLKKWKQNQPNGKLLSVSFGETKQIDEEYSIYMLPIRLNIEFQNNEGLMSFLSNVEEKLELDFPVFYKIDTMNYNIVEYEEKQQVDISINAYYIVGLPTAEEQKKKEENNKNTAKEKITKGLTGSVDPDTNIANNHSGDNIAPINPDPLIE